MNPHLDIKLIKEQISENGTKLAEHILMQPKIIRKFSQFHFREGMVSIYTSFLESNDSFIFKCCT